MEIKGSGDIYFEAIEDWKSGLTEYPQWLLIVWCQWREKGQSQNNAFQSELIGGKNIPWIHVTVTEGETRWQHAKVPRSHKRYSPLFTFPFASHRRNPCLKAVVKKSVEQE